MEAAGLSNVTFQQADIFDLPFAPQSFDHVFVCFVLEHLSRPADALRALRGVLKPGGTITVIEGDHGSAYFHPDSEHARKAIECLVTLQASAGGDATIGRRLYPLLKSAGFKGVQVSPRMVYADASKPELVEGFTRLTFTAMVEAVRAPALDAGLMTRRRLRPGRRGPVPHGGRGWRILLHLLQGAGGMLSPSRKNNALRRGADGILATSQPQNRSPKRELGRGLCRARKPRQGQRRRQAGAGIHKKCPIRNPHGLALQAWAVLSSVVFTGHTT